MRGIKAKRIRKQLPLIEPGYKKFPWGQVISPKRMAYQVAKGRRNP